MAAFVDNSSLDVSERNSMAITLNIHTNSGLTAKYPATSKLTPKLTGYADTRMERRETLGTKL